MATRLSNDDAWMPQCTGRTAKTTGRRSHGSCPAPDMTSCHCWSHSSPRHPKAMCWKQLLSFYFSIPIYIYINTYQFLESLYRTSPHPKKNGTFTTHSVYSSYSFWLCLHLRSTRGVDTSQASAFESCSRSLMQMGDSALADTTGFLKAVWRTPATKGWYELDRSCD